MSFPWKFFSAELLKWLHRLVEEEHSETGGAFVVDLLRRGALPLLFYARKAKNAIRSRGNDANEGCSATRDVVSALLCIRLLAQQLQSMVQSESESGAEAEETEGPSPKRMKATPSAPPVLPSASKLRQMDPELVDLALVLAHWVSTEWCSPRVEVVDYLPCCCDETSSFLLSTGCDHLKLKAVLDVVLFAPMPDGQEIGRQRLLHHGPWLSFSPVPGGWHTLYPAGAALHRWEEVTAAGLLLLAAARTFNEMSEGYQSKDQRRPTRPALLVYGACDGLLASFLAHHAPEVQVDVLEPTDDNEESGTFTLLSKHFDLRLGAAGLLQGSRRLLRDSETETGRHRDTEKAPGAVLGTGSMEGCGELTQEGLYDGIVVMKPFGAEEGRISSLRLDEVVPSLRQGGLLLVESERDQCRSLESLGDVVELNDLLQDGDDEEATDATVLCMVTPTRTREPSLAFEEVICPEKWFELLLERGGVRGGAPDVLDAQTTQVVPAGTIGTEDLATLKHLAHSARNAGLACEVRSPNSENWQVTFLQTNGFFEEHAPELLERFTALARSVALRQKWVTQAQADRFQARVIEWHQQEAPGPGIPDPRHYDMDSLVTVDVMCSAPGIDFLGGQLQTLEVEGLKEHRFQLYEILIFQAHKYHCVAPVVQGCRRALVLEFWDGPARRCPHRCTSFERFCPQEPQKRHSQQEKCEEQKKALGRLLPFRLAARKVSVSPSRRSMSLLWQCNEPTQ